MKPQDQRWCRGPVFDDNGKQTDEGGDCFSACLASILEVPIEGFPNFHGDTWFDRWQYWLYDNYRSELIYWGSEWPDPKNFAWWIAEVDNGIAHCVLFYKNQFKWDPVPEPDKKIWTIKDVKSVAALFSIASIFDRKDGQFDGTE